MFAQAQTEAGTLRQQIERELQPALPRLAPPLKLVEPPAPRGTAVTVSTFRFTGNTLLSNEQLTKAVSVFLNRPLDIAGLRAAADAVEAAYRDAGKMARVSVPPQEFANGTVTLNIIEAVYGGVLLEGPAPTRFSREALFARFSARQQPGAPLDTEAIDRALLLADDLPGLSVEGSLRPGRKEGTTELVLQVADEPLFTGELGTDNTGSRSTGSERLSANLSLGSPLGLGDQANANLIHTRGSDYGRLAYSIPLGNDGWRIGANASSLNYRLTAAEFSALNAHGSSTSFGLEANYPLLRSSMQNLFLVLNYENKRFDNQSSGATTTRYAIDNTAVSLNGNLFDTLGGGGANSANLTLTRGRVDLGGLDTAEDATRNGGFTKLRYALSRQQTLTESVALFAAYAGQSTDRNLDSAEKFYLGGASGVRAYPTSEGGGAAGQMFNLELRARLPEGFSLTGFYDHGTVRVNHDNAVGTNPNTITLKGAGLSLIWQSSVGLNLKATWSHRIGENPNPTSTGNDQDGTKIRNRLWLTALLTF